MSDFSIRGGRCPTVVDIFVTVAIALLMSTALAGPGEKGGALEGAHGGTMDPAKMAIII